MFTINNLMFTTFKTKETYLKIIYKFVKWN